MQVESRRTWLPSSTASCGSTSHALLAASACLGLMHAGGGGHVHGVICMMPRLLHCQPSGRAGHFKNHTCSWHAHLICMCCLVWEMVSDWLVSLRDHVQAEGGTGGAD